MIVVVAALKGGVGTTTTAVYLSAIAAKDHTVSLIDADAQASAADWLGAAEDRRLRDVELLEAPTERLVAKALNDTRDSDVVIVDTPSGNERLLARALTDADVAVIPTRVGRVETTRVDAVREMLPINLASGLVICSAKEHTLDHQDALREWKSARIPVWGSVPERVSIAAGPEARLLFWEGLRAYRDVWDRLQQAAA